MKTIVAFVAVASLLAAQGRKEPQALAALKFGWPVGTAALVETDYQRRGGPEPPAEISNIRMTHRMRVEAHVQGLVVRFDDQHHVASTGDFRQAAHSVLHFWTPRTVVAADGGITRIEDAESVRDLVVATLEPTQRFADQVPAIREFMAPLLGGNYLESLQKGAWNALVWQWIGMSPVQSRFETASSERIMPGLETPTKRTIEAVERSRCVRLSVEHDCVTVQMRTWADGAAMKPIFEKMRQALPGAPMMEPVDFELVVRVTIETATMLPHLAIETRSMHSKVGVNLDVMNIDFESRQSRFIYQDAAP